MEIKRVIIEEEVKDSDIVHSVLKKLLQLRKKAEIVYIDSPQEYSSYGNSLCLLNYRGTFFKNCPGTHFYNCCGYRIIHIGERCPLSCSYCILNAYFRHNSLMVWANIGDMFEELSRIFSVKDRLFRCGTGEFTDSLALEWLTGYSARLVDFLGDYPNVCLELKSKVVDLSWKDKVKDVRRVLPAWSMNSFDICASEEIGVSSLEERLRAARECIEDGFRICLHFDPLIYYPGWERGYLKTLEMIFDYLSPSGIAYLSLGSFRGMDSLFEYIKENWPKGQYLYWGEFIKGMDGKKRLFRPLRIKQFRFMVEKLRKWGLGSEIYLCMESDEVWRAVFGYTPRSLGGLSHHLKKLVFL